MVLVQRLSFSKAVVLIYIHGNNNIYTIYMGKEMIINFGLYFFEFGSLMVICTSSCCCSRRMVHLAENT